MSRWHQDPTARQEHLLLDQVERLGRFRAGRRAIHLHLSRLRPYNLRDHHLRIALTAFDDLTRRYDGGLFRMQSGDVVFIAKGVGVEEIEKAVQRLRFLFSEDPLLRTPGCAAGLCSWYDLEQDYDRLLEAARQLVDQSKGVERAHAAAQGAAPAVTQGQQGKQAGKHQAEGRPMPLDPGRLGQIEAALLAADVGPFVRSQAICAVSHGEPPKPVFHELYISIGDLRRALLPGYDLTSDCWLFQHMTQVLDLRMLTLFGARSDVREIRDLRAGAFSLNLNVSTILSTEFLQFDRGLSAEARATVVIEVQPLDIFADTGAFMFARDFLKDRGYRFCVDGLKHLMLPLVEREWLGFDLVKFHWGCDLIDDLAGKRGQVLKDVVARIGPERLIMTRCDSPDAARAGDDLGITLYQGRWFDGLLQRSRQPASAAGVADAASTAAVPD